MMDICGFRRIGKILAFKEKIVGILLKEKWRLLIWIVPHLDGMGGKIPTDAIDAVHGKYRITPPNWENNLFGRREDVTHVLFFHLLWMHELISISDRKPVCIRNAWINSVPFRSKLVWQSSKDAAVRHYQIRLCHTIRTLASQGA